MNPCHLCLTANDDDVCGWLVKVEPVSLTGIIYSDREYFKNVNINKILVAGEKCGRDRISRYLQALPFMFKVFTAF